MAKRRSLGKNAELLVTPEELRQKSTSTQKIVTGIKREYSELAGIISKTSSYWTGEGANAHRNKFNEQKSDVDEMFDRINEHIVELQKMAGIYTEAEEDSKAAAEDGLPSDVII